MLTANLHKLKTLIPLHELESGAQQQIYEALELDFLKTLAVMPDCHTGYLLCIGGVALLDNVVCPEYVGYDQMCGMCYSRAYGVSAQEVLKVGWRHEVLKEIYKKIPVGFQCRTDAQDYPEFKSALGDKVLDDKVNAKLRVQLGTLGSGNHFIEIGESKEGELAIVIHSGSRKAGHTLAGHYMKLAHKVDQHLPGPFLDLAHDVAKAFLEDLAYMEKYALKNRLVMMADVVNILGLEGADFFFVNEHHNSAIVTPAGILHRKGATPAERGQFGIIPGNMRDGTYVTIGLGNEKYLCSASHGAGRTMGRKQAKRLLSLADFQSTMANVVALVDESTLDEAPMAYKNLEEVIARQRGIVVDVIDHIRPLINIKG